MGKHLLQKIKITSFIIALVFVGFSCSDNTTGPNSGSNNGNNNGSGSNQEYSHTRGNGESAHDFLSGDTFTRLEVELDYMPNEKPTQQALDSLKKFLSRRLNKSGGIVINVSSDPVPSMGKNTYTIEDIHTLEENNRDTFTHGDTLSAYMMLVDGQYEQNNVLGLAYYNTSMAFMEKTIQDHSGGLNQPPRYKIEATVMDHEFGHNMGLVANGSPMQQDHKTSNSHHCNVDGCLMQPAVNTSDFFANVFDGSIPDLDPLCIDDLQANGGK